MPTVGLRGSLAGMAPCYRETILRGTQLARAVRTMGKAIQTIQITGCVQAA